MKRSAYADLFLCMHKLFFFHLSRVTIKKQPFYKSYFALVVTQNCMKILLYYVPIFLLKSKIFEIFKF
jgi:hypothetical protein